MQDPIQDEGFSAAGFHHDPYAEVHESEVPRPVAHNRSDDELEAESVKYNVARIVRLSSGRFALFSHYRAGALDIIKMGTIEEIVDHIPSADECSYTVPRERVESTKQTKLTKLDLTDLGL